MSPILDMQRRIAEAGRIRIGQQVPAGDGKTRPEKLTTFRLTSADRQRIEQAAELYGGKVTEWQAPAGKQWQVITTSDTLNVIVPPSDLSFSQTYELWSAGGCLRRCDGVTEMIGEQPCACDPEHRECDIHTRLSVMLRDLPGLGVWRIDTSGYYAAVELAGAVELIAMAAGRGTLLPARLRLDQRSVKRPDAKGKPQTLRFAVPVLDIDISPAQLLAGGAGQPLALVTKDSPLTPVPELETTPSIAEQSRPPAARARRANAPPDLPASGRRRGAARDEPPTADLPLNDGDRVIEGDELERWLRGSHAAMRTRTEGDVHEELRRVAAGTIELGDRSLNELTLTEWRWVANAIASLPVTEQPAASVPAGEAAEAAEVETGEARATASTPSDQPGQGAEGVGQKAPAQTTGDPAPVSKPADGVPTAPPAHEADDPAEPKPDEQAAAGVHPTSSSPAASSTLTALRTDPSAETFLAFALDVLGIAEPVPLDQLSAADLDEVIAAAVDDEAQWATLYARLPSITKAQLRAHRQHPRGRADRAASPVEATPNRPTAEQLKAALGPPEA